MRSSSRNYPYILIAFLCAKCALSSPSDVNITSWTAMSNVWQDVYRMTGQLLEKCMLSTLARTTGKSQDIDQLQSCLKRRSLLALDRTIRREVIRLGGGMELVRITWSNETYNRSWGGDDWMKQVAERMARVMRTHVLRIYFDNHSKDVTGRRRKDKDMSSLLMFSMVAMGMIMVPLGFQFLAVLGGKALLLAKMALILASIQGLKKLATSNLNYGFYQTQPGGYGGHSGGHDHGNCKTTDGLLTKESQLDSSGTEDLITFEFKIEDLSGS